MSSQPEPGWFQRISRWGQRTELRTAEELRDHMLLTYVYLRWALVALGFLLPVLLVILGLIFRLPDQSWFQGSMSAYYRTPMRDIFVGGLWAIGSCLLLYKGYTQEEDWALNVAGVSSILVALFPLDYPEGGYDIGGIVLNPHGAAALLFFVCCAIVAYFQADKTLGVKFTPKDESETEEAREAREKVWRKNLGSWYKVLGVVLFVGPIGIGVWVQVTNITLFENIWLLVAETLAFWVFALYWGVKGYEIDFLTRVEKKAVKGEIEEQAGGKIVPTGMPQGAEANNNPVTDTGSPLPV
jgi:hypothetical protein